MAARDGRRPAWGVAALLIAVLMEIPLSLPLARTIKRLAGEAGDVGSEFLGFWLFAILPGAVAFGVAVFVFSREIASDPDGRSRNFLRGAWLANGLLFLGSAIFYLLRFSWERP